ncbi:MAG: helix-turn-helix transcriptional regulator [Burkholderiaceae bacterium]|nr:helix-turn-helix transcriptional regulator [Burkholderiaceae bacterium]
MVSLHDLLLESNAFDANVIYAGRQCSRANTARDYPGGCFHFIRSGTAELVIPGQPNVLIDQPSLVFFANARAHAVQAVDVDGVEMVCAVASYDKAFTRAVELSFPDYLIVPLHHLSAIGQVLEAFFTEAQSRTPGSKTLANRLCMVVLTYLTHSVMQRNDPSAGLLGASADQRIAAVVSAIHDQFDNELDLETLAGLAGMSRSRFVERFAELVGKSPHHYLMNYRITMAKRLLATGLPVKVVAMRVGYQTASAFVRKFRELEGVTPGAWAQ